jgi:hypothetical protein
MAWGYSERPAAFHDHAIGEGAAVAFVGVDDDVFTVARRRRDGAPFDSGREPGAAASAKARIGDLFDSILRTERNGALKTLVAAQYPVGFERTRSVMPQRAKVSRCCFLR